MRTVFHLNSQTTQIDHRLSAFVDVFDADGAGEVARVVAEFPASGLGWVLDNERLDRRESDGQRWFGSSRLQAPGWQRLPSGRLRIEVYDLSGRSDARELLVRHTEPPRSRDEFPRIEGSALLSPNGFHEVFAVSENGRSVRIEVDESGRVDLRTLTDAQRQLLATAERWTLVVEDGAAVRRTSGPWIIPGA